MFSMRPVYTCQATDTMWVCGNAWGCASGINWSKKRCLLEMTRLGAACLQRCSGIWTLQQAVCTLDRHCVKEFGTMYRPLVVVYIAGWPFPCLSINSRRTLKISLCRLLQGNVHNPEHTQHQMTKAVSVSDAGYVVCTIYTMHLSSCKFQFHLKQPWHAGYPVRNKQTP